MLKDELGTRLRGTREQLNLSRDEVVLMSNKAFSRSTLQQWEGGTTEPSVTSLQILAKLYNVSLKYLIFGDDSHSISSPSDDKQSDNDNYAYIPLRNHIQASAGGGYINEDKNDVMHLVFRKDWLHSKGLKTKDLEAITAKGDSMEPTIPDDSTILIDHSKTNALDGRIYVVRIDNQLYIKRIQWLPTGLRLISDNSIYKPIDLSKADLDSSNIEVYGQVVHISYDLPH